METKAGERDAVAAGWGWRLVLKVREAAARRPSVGAAETALTDAAGPLSPPSKEECPSVMRLAHFESGDLNDLHGAAMRAHVGRCIRCRAFLAEIRQARSELLGPTANARCAQSRRAAVTIETILRRRNPERPPSDISAAVH